MALASIGEKEALPALVNALNDPDVLVRVAAIYAIGEVGDAQLETALRERLLDTPWEVRSAIIETLATLGIIADEEAIDR